jgi:hypothetical protein
MRTSAIPHLEPRARALALALALSAILAAALPRAHGGRADYVGAQACKDCHAEAYAAWEQSAHARSDASLRRDTNSPRKGACLACHTTGEAPAGQAFLAGVQCEACHGPGAGYASDDVMRNPTLARLLGLRDLSTPAARAALCAQCHARTTRLLPFDAEAAYRRIQHH